MAWGLALVLRSQVKFTGQRKTSIELIPLSRWFVSVVVLNMCFDVYICTLPLICICLCSLIAI